MRDGSTETRVVEVSRRARTLTDTGVELVSIVDTDEAGEQRRRRVRRRQAHQHKRHLPCRGPPARDRALAEPVEKYRLSDTEDLRTFVEAESPR